MVDSRDDGAGTPQQPGDLVALARRRLSEEIERLPPWPSTELRLRLRSINPGTTVSFGALTHFIRAAARAGDPAAARDLFSALCARISGLIRRWAMRVVFHTRGVPQGMRDDLREDLCQELVLHLWEQVALGTSVAWELFFLRSLDFAQRHVATTQMRRRGYWASIAGEGGSPALTELRLSLSGDVDDDLRDLHGQDGVSAASDLVDLRELVLRLPTPERVVVVMRYWQSAPEREIAVALGGVSTRTVRNHLRRAHERLRTLYLGSEATS